MLKIIRCFRLLPITQNRLKPLSMLKCWTIIFCRSKVKQILVNEVNIVLLNAECKYDSSILTLIGVGFLGVRLVVVVGGGG